MTRHACCVDSPAGRLRITEEDGRIVGVAVTQEVLSVPCTPAEQRCVRQLEEYFSGRRRVFDVPVFAQGTAFQRQVWAAAQTIPYGETRTYGELARQMGMPGGARAVGGALHRNPLLILIPCHRVVGTKGLTGFAAGLSVKERLLAAESR